MKTAHSRSTPKEIRQVIENSHLFRGLRPDFIDKIASTTTGKTIGAGEILFQKGDPADALWGVLSGRILIEVRTDDGKEMVLDSYGKGEVFGEVGVLDFGLRRVEARAVQQSKLFRLERKHFLKHLQNSPELCFRVLSLLCSRLRDSTENLEDTALHKLPNRLAKRLTLLAADSETDDGTILHIVQSDLADMLGVHRQAVNKHLRKFEKDGLIVLKRQMIEIVDQQALADLASPGQNGNSATWATDNPDTLKFKAVPVSQFHEVQSNTQERHLSGIMAIDSAEYSRALMTDAAGTLKRIEAGLKAVDRAIEQHQGHTAWHTGDRILAEFPDAQLAMQAALAIQEQVNPSGRADKDKQDSLFQIGVHYGEVLVGDHRFSGEAVNTAIRLTQFSGIGGIAISGVIRDSLENREQVEFQFLGDHELKNVSGTVPVYSARTIPILRMLVLRAETFMPRRFRPAALFTALIILAAGIWFGGDRMGRQNASVEVLPLSIAVLPFTTGANASLDYLAESIPQEIRTTLSTIPGMRVIGQVSSSYYNDHPASTEEIGQTLKVAWLLRGNFQSLDDETRVTAQLLNTASGKVVWEEQFAAFSEHYAGIGPDLIQGMAGSMGITNSVVAALPQLTPLTLNPEAYALYIEAKSQIWLGTLNGAIEAIALLQGAIELDPTLAEAHALLSKLYLFHGWLDQLEQYNPELRRDLSAKSLKKATTLKPDSPLVLAVASMARWKARDYDGALSMAERALRIDPNNIEALRARSYVQHIRLDLAGTLQTQEEILNLEPLSVETMAGAWAILTKADRHQEALEIANRILALYPEEGLARVHGWVSDSKLKLGDRLGAIQSYRKGLPDGLPADLWTGLDIDQNAQQEWSPWASKFVPVYVGEYESIRPILINRYNNVEENAAWLNSFSYLVCRGELESLAGDYNTAIAYFEKARLLTPDEQGGLAARKMYTISSRLRQSHHTLALLFAYRQTGQHGKAEIIAGQFEALLNRERATLSTISEFAQHRFLYQEAQYLAIEGKTVQAIDKLRAWMNHGIVFTYIGWDPFLSSLRDNPNFEAIVAEVESELAEVRAQYHAQRASFPERSDG